MKKTIILLLLLNISEGFAQIPINSLKFSYTQNFNTLAHTGASSTLPQGWLMAESGTNKNSSYAASSGSDIGGNTYSYGILGDTERALGGLQSGSLNPTIGVSFMNCTGDVISKVELSYIGEQWRLGAAGRIDRLDFQYSIDATSLTTGTWTDINDLDFIAPISSGTIGQLNGNLAANRTLKSFSILGVNFANGNILWIRWTDYNAAGSDDGLAVDDFSLIYNPVVAPYSPLATVATNISSIGFTANWSLQTDVTKYFLDVATDSLFTNILMNYNNQDVGNVTSVNILGLNPHTQYHYRVRAFNSMGTSLNSNIISVLTNEIVIPVIPTARSATEITTTGFTSHWNDSEGSTNYYLDISLSNEFNSFVVGYNNLEVKNVTSFNVTGLYPNTTYYYRVRASNISGTSASSNTIIVTTSNPISTDLIVNEWSQGSDGAKEWVEILIVEDNFNLQNYKLMDGNGNLSISLSGNGFKNLRKGSLIIIYNGGDIDGAITADLSYNGTTDKNLQISSLNNSGNWAVTRIIGWNSITGAFTNGSIFDVPKIQNSISSDIFFSPISLNSNKVGYYSGNTSVGATDISNWNTNSAYRATPGTPNGGNNSLWIDNDLTTINIPPPNIPVAEAATKISTNGFIANWSASNNTVRYFLDVATDNLFTIFIAGYYNKDVGIATSEIITEVNPNTQYYYRVRASNKYGTSGNSNIISPRTLALTSTVQFTNPRLKVSENAGILNVLLNISNPDVVKATQLDVVIIGGTGSAEDIDDYMTQKITFPAGSSEDQTLILNLKNDYIFEGHETITFEIQNVSGGNNARVGTINKFELTIMDPVDLSYYAGIDKTLTGASMKGALHNLIKGHRKYFNTSSNTPDVWDILMEAYEDSANTNSVKLLYSGRSQAKAYNSSAFGSDKNAWNREHVWAQSRGGFDVEKVSDNPGVATDVHNLAPEDASIITDKENKDFDIGGIPHAEAQGCKSDLDSWEPMDAVKGDVARILFYMDTRYEGDDGEVQLELVDYTSTPVGTVGKLSTLLLWHRQDPPDAFEINRNNLIYTFQGNKNPFIDHPEWVEAIYGANSAPVISNITRSRTIPDVNQNLTVSAEIIDDDYVASAVLLFSVDDGPEQIEVMTNNGGTTYSGLIPGVVYNNGNLLKYRIRALDNNNNARFSSYSSLFTGTINISKLHQVDANGSLIYNKTFAKVRGVATVSNGIFSNASLETVIQDGSGAITIYKFAGTGIPFTANKNYTIIGSLTQVNGLAELIPESVVTDIIDEGFGITPSAKIFTINQLLANSEPNESKLIKIKNVIKISGTWAGGQNLVITDDGVNLLALCLDTSVKYWGTEPIWPKDLVGIFSQFDTSPPFLDSYQIKPRSTSDFLEVPTKYLVTPSNLSPSVGSEIRITIQLLDSQNNPVDFEGRLVKWSSTNGGEFSSLISITDANGRATVNFKVNSIINTIHIVSVEDSSETTLLTGKSENITTVGGVPAGFILSSKSEKPTVGSDIIISAQLVDQLNNALNIPGKVITWTSTNGGSFSSLKSTTAANGIATVTFKVNYTAGTSYEITATDNSTPTPLTGKSNRIITVEDVPYKYVLTSNSYNPVVGSNVTIAAQLEDQYGNRSNVGGKIVTWTSTWNGSFSSITSTTDDKGRATVVFTVNQKSKKNHKVTATDNTLPSPIKGISDIILTVSGKAVKYLVTPSTKIPRAGGTITVTAQLSDQYDNEVETERKIISWISTSDGTFSSSTSQTDEYGKASISFTVSQLSGVTHVITTTDDSTPIIIGMSDNIKTIADLAAKYMLAVSNVNPAAGSIISITAQLADKYNNPVNVQGKVITWSSSNGGNFSVSTSTTGSNGRSTVTFTVNQMSNTGHSISVSDNSAPVPLFGTLDNIITTNGPASKYIITVNNFNPIVGSVLIVTAQLVDIFGNPVGSDNNNLLWSGSSGGQFKPVTTQTDLNGKSVTSFIVSSKANTIHNISVKDDSSNPISGLSDNITTLVGSAVKYRVTSNQELVIAGSMVKITAQIVDQYENPINLDGKFINWSSSNGGSFSSINNLTNGNGFATADFTTNQKSKTIHIISVIDLTGLSGFSKEIVTYKLKPDKPVLLSPLNNSAKIDINPIFTWDETKNVSYIVQLSKTPTFNPIEREIDNIENVFLAIKNLENKTKYFWRVAAKNEIGNSDYSEVFNFSTKDSIDHPSELYGFADADFTVNLSWKDNSNNEEGFIVERADIGSVEYKLVGNVDAGVIIFKDSNVDMGKKYKYRVTAYNSETSSSSSNIFEITVPIRSLSFPTNLTFRPNASGYIVIKWDYKFDNAQGFNLERIETTAYSGGDKVNQVFRDDYVLIAKLPYDVRMFTDVSSKEGVFYNYRLTAYNAEGFSLPASFPESIIVLKHPNNLKVTNENQMYAKLSWNDLSNDEEGFEIVRSVNALNLFQSILKSKANVIQYIDSAIVDGRKYLYRVNAFAGNYGLSTFSNQDSIFFEMKAPTNLRVEQLSSQNKTRLIWKDNSNSESGYIIERRLLSDSKYVVINETLPNTEIYLDGTVINRQKYIYRIKGFNEITESSYSNETSILVGIEKHLSTPTQFVLNQNYPNPFNPETVISFEIPKPCHVTLKIFDLLGSEVATLVDEFKDAGSYQSILAVQPASLTSGIYFYQMRVGQHLYVKKMQLIK